MMENLSYWGIDWASGSSGATVTWTYPGTVNYPTKRMAKFKIGDMVSVVGNRRGNFKTSLAQIISEFPGEVGVWNVIGIDKDWRNSTNHVDEGDLLLIKSENKMSNLQEKVALLFKGEPEKSFIKTGIMGANGDLTSEGREVFCTWLFEQNKSKFNEEVVQPLLKEMTDK